MLQLGNWARDWMQSGESGHVTNKRSARTWQARDEHVTLELKAEEKLVALVQLDSSDSFIKRKSRYFVLRMYIVINVVF